MTTRKRMKRSDLKTRCLLLPSDDDDDDDDAAAAYSQIRLNTRAPLCFDCFLSLFFLLLSFSPRTSFSLFITSFIARALRMAENQVFGFPHVSRLLSQEPRPISLMCNSRTTHSLVQAPIVHVFCPFARYVFIFIPIVKSID